jgi:tetratricopeptide (TPR) repeat protein
LQEDGGDPVPNSARRRGGVEVLPANGDFGTAGVGTYRRGVDDWAARVAAVWADADSRPEADVAAVIETLVAERDPDDAIAVFELAGVRDYAGREAEAEPLYRRALELGLDEPQRGQAVIQLASTVRNLGRPDEALALLREEFAAHPEHPLADAATAFAALALADTGAEREALVAALRALAPHLPAYGRAVTAYADDLLG